MTAPASSPAAPMTPVSVPYVIPGSTSSPVDTSTRIGTGYAMATGYAKRIEMRGLKQERKERKRGARFW